MTQNILTIKLVKETILMLNSEKRDIEDYDRCIRRLIKEKNKYKSLYMHESIQTRKILEVLLSEDEEVS